jgi:FkbM family methyltransferase
MNISRRIIRVLKPLIDKFPAVGLAYRTWRDTLASTREPALTPLGFRFGGNRMMAEGRFEEEEVEIARNHLASADILINVGANIGYYCCIALSLGKKVIAFEPIPLNLFSLYRNITANGWNDIEIFPLALGNRHGVITIFGGGTGASLIEGWAGTPTYYSRMVPINTLDNILGTRLAGTRSFFLIDVEGGERGVLEGAEKQLTLNPKPVWMVEIQTTSHQPSGRSVNPDLQRTFEMFWNHEYEAWTAERKPRT